MCQCVLTLNRVQHEYAGFAVLLSSLFAKQVEDRWNIFYWALLIFWLPGRLRVKLNVQQSKHPSRTDQRVLEQLFCVSGSCNASSGALRMAMSLYWFVQLARQFGSKYRSNFWMDCHELLNIYGPQWMNPTDFSCRVTMAFVVLCKMSQQLLVQTFMSLSGWIILTLVISWLFL